MDIIVSYLGPDKREILRRTVSAVPPVKSKVVIKTKFNKQSYQVIEVVQMITETKDYYIVYLNEI